MINKYFAFGWQHKPELASAFAANENQVAYILIPELEEKTEMPFEFHLRKITEGKEKLIIDNDLLGLKEIWLDYQPNSLAWPLMSEKLKNVIDKNLTGKEGIDWITAKVNGDEEQRMYYIPRFSKKLDVLDLKNTRYVPGTDRILKSTFSSSKISAYNIFPEELKNNLWKITSFLFVSEILKKAIQKEHLTGIEFGNISVS